MPWVLLALLLVAQPSSPTHARERAAACRQACDDAIARCVTTGGSFGLDERTCRRAVLRSCKRGASAACAPSTDLPPSHPPAGTWLFTLRECVIKCPSPGNFMIDCERTDGPGQSSIVRFEFDNPELSAPLLDVIDTKDGRSWLGRGPGSAPSTATPSNSPSRFPPDRT
jgi:hypothetical protein